MCNLQGIGHCLLTGQDLHMGDHESMDEEPHDFESGGMYDCNGCVTAELSSFAEMRYISKPEAQRFATHTPQQGSAVSGIADTLPCDAAVVCEDILADDCDGRPLTQPASTAIGTLHVCNSDKACHAGAPGLSAQPLFAGWSCPDLLSLPLVWHSCKGFLHAALLTAIIRGWIGNRNCSVNFEFGQSLCLSWILHTSL